MPYSPFIDRFPDLGELETRSITVPRGSDVGLPSGEYIFFEMYCDDPGCDCRRVFWMVLCKQLPGRILAVITYGWEDRSFYAQWLGFADHDMVTELKGPILNAGSPRSKYAPKLLEIARDILIPDPDYMARIKRHYRMFRDSVDAEPKPRRIRLPRAARKRRC